MIRPGFLTFSERRELEDWVRSHREDHGVARRANAILLLDDGKSCQVIAEFLYLDDDTIRGWYKTYHEAGWDALSSDGWKGGQSRMTSYQRYEHLTHFWGSKLSHHLNHCPHPTWRGSWEQRSK